MEKQSLTPGQQLDLIFNESDQLHQQMRDIVTRNNIELYDLAKLPEADYNEWYRLYQRTNELSDQASKIVLKATNYSQP